MSVADMAYLHVNDHFSACSTAALDNVSSGPPEEILKLFIKKALTHPRYVSGLKAMADEIHFGYYIHVFFAGPDHSNWPAASRDHHYSLQGGSCDKFAAYLRANNLGPVVQTEGRWNHRHANRKPGHGDVIAYVWSPDAKALEAWYLARKAAKKESPK